MSFQTKPAPRWHEWAGPILATVPLILVFLIPLMTIRHDPREREACLSNGGQRVFLIGTLRASMTDFFVQVDNNWRRISHSCSGKNANQCWATDPGLRAMRDSVGRLINVEFCEDQAISYEINGNRYELPRER